MIKKVLIGGVLAATAFAMTGGSVWAFECFNSSRSDNGNANAAHGQALMTVEEVLAAFVGLCPDGVDHVVDGLNEQGFETDMLINGRSLMAGGLEHNGDKNGNLHNGKGIDHLSDEFLAAGDTLIGEAFGICGAPD
jgi:hypothetical protein